MEDEFDKGKARALGISNFNHLQIEELLGYARIKPVSQQVRRDTLFCDGDELNIYFTSRGALNWSIFGISLH
jgi:diketogulonate reductase-like aldo/keto reductase